MKKSLLFAVAVLALAACSKVSLEIEDGVIDASKLVFNIDVQNVNATKGVKTAWEDGDDVYVFFEDNTTQYVKMTYNGTSWTYADKEGFSEFTGLALTASGKKLSAVYMPDFVCSAAPTYDTDKWTFGAIQGYFQKAEAVSYTVTSTDNVNTLNATISLAAPAGISQIFVPSTEYAALESGEEYVLTATHFIPFNFSGIVPGGDAEYGTTVNGFPLTAHAGSLGGDTGLYFWGLLEGAGTYDFDFQLVKQNAANKYAISSQFKSVTDKTVGSSFAAKITGLTDRGKFVSLGYDGGPLWATGNLDKTNNTIVDPLAAGEYFMYGYTTTYNSSDSRYWGEESPLGTEKDAAYQANNAWRIPTKAQFDALITNTTAERKTGWTTIGGNNSGYLVTSKSNGISLFFAAAGYYSGSLQDAGNRGLYRSSTPASDGAYDPYTQCAFVLRLDSYGFITEDTERTYGSSIRPVKN